VVVGLSPRDALVEQVGYAEQQIVELSTQPVRLRCEALDRVGQLPGPSQQRLVTGLRELPRQQVLLRPGRLGARSRLAPALIEREYFVDGRRLAFELGCPLHLVRMLADEVQ